MINMKKWCSVLLVLTLVSTVFTQVVQAESKQSLVSLGDSIPFGWNLSNKNSHPSKEAFPAIVSAEENYRVRNLSVGGDTTTDLLLHLKTSKYREAIAHADFITLDIGSNDFLQGAKPIITKLLSTPDYKPALEDMLLLGSITQQLGINLSAIIGEIRSFTDAPIILYNIYNPFYGYDAQAGAMLAGANQFIKSFDIDPSIVVADAFSAFVGKQNALILPGDVHPNQDGQETLAKLALDAIETLN
jgi:lysophospholipase L1-like esterase